MAEAVDVRQSRQVAQGELVVLILEAWWVANRRVDVLQSNWEVNDEKVKVVNAPVCELLLANWLDAFTVVERVPAAKFWVSSLLFQLF